MEILLDVPPLLAALLQWILNVVGYLTSCWSRFADNVHAFGHQLSSLLRLPPGAILPLTVVLVFFWPVLIYLVMAVATAWGWILWVLTSIVFGVLQLTYVVYQFVMISGDICGLSVLKTYSMIRSQVLNLFDRSGHSLRKSQRKIWRMSVEEADSYENFVKIRIEPKTVPTSATTAVGLPSTVDKHDSALPPPSSPKRMTRVHSFSNATGNTAGESPPRASILRNRSFSGDVNSITTLSSSDLDPLVVEELGERTTDLLVTTTQRLMEARRAAVSTTPTADNGTSSKSMHAINSLMYLLSGVIKRNHLKLDDFAVENARSVCSIGRYWLSKNSRSVIRSYYEQVERGLEVVAESSLEKVDQHELLDRITVVRKMKQNMGRTAVRRSWLQAVQTFVLHLSSVTSVILFVISSCSLVVVLRRCTILASSVL
jgi:hypothetical protein